MASDENDFLESLKVDVTQTRLPRISSSDRDVYTCLKIMGDTSKIQNFLLSASKQEVNGEKISTDMSMNYFYNVNAKLGYAEYDFREGKIGGNEFNNRMDEICKSHDVDFNYLMEITDQINALEKRPNREESIKLAQSIETKAIEEHEKRMNQEKEK